MKHVQIEIPDKPESFLNDGHVMWVTYVVGSEITCVDIMYHMYVICLTSNGSGTRSLS